MSQARSNSNGDKPIDTATTQTTAPGEVRSVSLGVRLVPVNNSDQPLFANYTALNATPGIAFIDFAFLEPSVLAALPRAEKVPESINGRLVVRVALAPDALQNLARQINNLLRPPQQQQAQQGTDTAS